MALLEDAAGHGWTFLWTIVVVEFRHSCCRSTGVLNGVVTSTKKNHQGIVTFSVNVATYCWITADKPSSKGPSKVPIFGLSVLVGLHIE